MNFDEAEGVHRTSSLADQDDAHQTFCAETLLLSIRSQGRYRVREFANALRLIAQEPDSYTYEGQTFPENAQTRPFAIVTVIWNGDFSTFSPELAGQENAEYSNFVLGNVASVGYLEAAKGEVFGRLWEDVRRGISTCEAECAYFKYCGGGAPANGKFDSAETLYCRSMLKRPFEAVLRSMTSDGIMPASTA